MHPRNIFQTSPDFTALAIKYPDFRKICKLELNGKVRIDYKNETALRLLTQTLLLEYFQLNIVFAPGSLVPALPLRVNYILWMEDLLESLCSTVVKGIDIGCGSSCIYSLLAAKKNGWTMLALESNTHNVEYARNNIICNGLEDKITLFPQRNKEQIFQEYFSSEVSQDIGRCEFDFCLCNPPFFDSLSEKTNTRNPLKRPPPHNCPTGQKEELFCEGGEVNFVKKIINESIEYQQKIRIFSTMLGLKLSLNHLLAYLETKAIHNHCTTVFNQGNTTRWGLAWTFRDSINLSKLKTKISK